MPYRIFLFEDRDDHFEQVEAAIHKRVPATLRVELVRFTHGFRKPAESIHSIDNDGNPVTVTHYPAYRREELAHSPAYFQEDFDAAILDQFRETTAKTNWGRRYLEWFRYGGFQGRIAIISERSQIDVDAQVKPFTKSGDWALNAADHVLIEGRAVETEDSERSDRVNFRGRNPDNFLTGPRGFYVRHSIKLNLPKWRQAFLGSEEELAERLSKFFGLEWAPRLAISGSLEEVHAALMAEERTREAAEIAAILQSANVIWIDCGEELTEEKFRAAEQIVVALASNPIPIFLGEHLKMDQASQITALAALWLKRSRSNSAASLVLWAGESIKDFAAAYGHFETTVRDDRGTLEAPPATWSETTLEAANRTIETLLAPQLLSRRHQILCGKKTPSLARWIDEQTGKALNQSLPNRIVPMAKHLAKTRPPRLSEQQIKRFINPSGPKKNNKNASDD